MSEPTKIDITSTAIEKSIDLIKDFLLKIAGPSADELGLFAGDKIRLWRFKNQIKILQQAQQYVKENNINIKSISPKMLVPLLDNASLEDESSLQEMWVALLVNNIDSAKAYESSVFPYILSQLSKFEASWIKDAIESQKSNSGTYDRTELSLESISNLIRLGLIKELPPKITVKPKSDILPKVGSTSWGFKGALKELDYVAEYDQARILQATHLAKVFIEACTLRK